MKEEKTMKKTVEDILKNANELMTLEELKGELPRKAMHQTLIQILDDLQVRGKIIMGTKGILWISTSNSKLDKEIKKGLEI